MLRPMCCAICGVTLQLRWPCQQDHPDHCHDCYARSLAGSLDGRAHRLDVAPRPRVRLPVPTTPEG